MTLMRNEIQDQKMFYQHVKKKIEPFVVSAWVNKINHKGKKDERFFVATQSQMYLCKQTLFAGSLKISRTFPWVSISAVSQSRPNQIVFEFFPLKITIESKEIDKIATHLKAFFLVFFPPENQIRFEFNTKGQVDISSKYQNIFPSLFISFCHAHHISLNESFCNKLKKKLKEHPDFLDLTELPIDKKNAPSLFAALELSRDIIRVKLADTKYFYAFTTLAKVLTANPNIREITVCDISNFDGFDAFISSLPHTKITSLGFYHCSFNLQNFKTLLKSSHMTVIETLKFSECDINLKMTQAFLKKADNFEEISSFALMHDIESFPKSVWPDFCAFIIRSCLKELNLSNANLDIGEFLSVLQKKNNNIHVLDLSLNYCTSSAKFPYLFPACLDRLVFSRVNWDGGSLCRFLTLQEFKSDCFVDLSEISIIGHNWEMLFALMEKTNPPRGHFTGLAWTDNPLDPRILSFISRLTSLKAIDLSRVTYDEHKATGILNQLVVLFQTASISSFSMRGAKKNSHSSILKELLPVMQTRSTVENLDLANNVLGNSGIEALTRFVEASNSLKSISFDGNWPSKPAPFISLLRAIGRSPRLIDAVYPAEDIKRVIQATPASKDQIKKAWKEVQAQIAENGSVPFESSDVSFYTSLQSLSTQSAKLMEPREEVFLSASWDVAINIPFQSGFAAWEEMRNRYTVRALEGIVLD